MRHAGDRYTCYALFDWPRLMFRCEVWYMCWSTISRSYIYMLTDDAQVLSIIIRVCVTRIFNDVEDDWFRALYSSHLCAYMCVCAVVRHCFESACAIVNKLHNLTRIHHMIILVRGVITLRWKPRRTEQLVAVSTQCIMREKVEWKYIELNYRYQVTHGFAKIAKLSALET